MSSSTQLPPRSPRSPQLPPLLPPQLSVHVAGSVTDPDYCCVAWAQGLLPEDVHDMVFGDRTNFEKVEYTLYRDGVDQAKFDELVNALKFTLREFPHDQYAIITVE